MEKFGDKIRELIEKGDLEGAIDTLLDCLTGKNAQFRDEAIQHKSSLSWNNENIRIRTITNEEANRVRARISHAILSLLKIIEKEDIKLGGGNVKKIKILFLGANPVNTTRIRIDKELREIDTALRMARERDNILLSQRWAVTTQILTQAILDENPNIIHFSGHGTDEGIVLEDDNGNYKLVPGAALKKLFSLFSDVLECVVLNACYSKIQAKAISKHIPYVIGMRSAVPDKAAISFSTDFYSAFGAKKDIEFAYDFGVNNMKLKGIDGDNIPILIKKKS